MKYFFVAILLFLAAVNALQVKTLAPQVTIAPCQSAVIPFEVIGNGPVSFSLLNLPVGLSYSAPQHVNINERTTVDVHLLYPCDAYPSTGPKPFSLVASQGSEHRAATTQLFVSPQYSLAINLVGEELTCTCSSGRFTLELRNLGNVREQGSLLVSSQFPFAISDSYFDLLPGESVSKQITVDLNCSTTAGVYPLSVGVASKNKGITYKHSAINAVQCFNSKLSGPANVGICYGDPLDIEYVAYNNGNFGQWYSLSSTLGDIPSSNFYLEPHSAASFNVSIPYSLAPQPGNYNFSLSLFWDAGSESLPVELTTSLCPGKAVPVVNASYPELEQNNTLRLFPGRNAFSINVTNPNNFSLTRAVLHLSEFGPISSLFDLLPRETKLVAVVVNVPANFTAANAILTLESDQGRNGKVVSLQTISPFSGLFTLAGVEESQLVGAIIVLLVIAVLLFYYYSEKRKQVLIDNRVSKHLHNILARHARR